MMANVLGPKNIATAIAVGGYYHGVIIKGDRIYDADKSVGSMLGFVCSCCRGWVFDWSHLRYIE